VFRLAGNARATTNRTGAHDNPAASDELRKHAREALDRLQR
jgi:hypothetical protein